MNATLLADLQQTGTANRWFMPPELTPLYHTAIYADLREEERLSYNQLHGLYFHEQIIFFEQSIICPTLTAVRKGTRDPDLRSSIDQFIAEEKRHSAAFHDLLRQAAPRLYGDAPRYFIRINTAATAALDWGVSRPTLLPMYLWLVLLLEERAMHCSRVFLRHEGDLATPFFDIQRKHLADEVDHVQWDEQVITAVWPQTARWLRELNVRFMDWMLREFIVAPKRAAVRVLDELAARHPALGASLPRLRKEVRDLGQTADFQQSIFCPPVAPRSQKLMSNFPEFDEFQAYWFRHER
jgi:P-aminobenzoate N-oxygenase AurF